MRIAVALTGLLASIFGLSGGAGASPLPASGAAGARSRPMWPESGGIARLYHANGQQADELQYAPG